MKNYNPIYLSYQNKKKNATEYYSKRYQAASLVLHFTNASFYSYQKQGEEGCQTDPKRDKIL